MGYFATLYRRVTRGVKEGIDQGKFQNGPLIERLDVVFANRYLTAYDQYRSGQTPTLSWQLAFRSRLNSLKLPQKSSSYCPNCRKWLAQA